ncbi:hypothetical protein BC938DRAFT_483751 [Jimgerdemannia flammicorona]|uniref:Uncharacterized protein n=1 Tax=Jimgerdemannia flammicorona TaxID=994334 RepID=A0A433QBB5_9FUNG|nr:hypothetical protein BC938DRAFT_483751 [Jimgerdemannia flammicorona]
MLSLAALSHLLRRSCSLVHPFQTNHHADLKKWRISRQDIFVVLLPKTLVIMDDPSVQGHALNGNSVTHHVFLEVNGDNISNNGMETKDGMSPDLISPAGQSLPASTWASGGDFCASEAFLAQVSNERKEVHGQKLNLPKVSEKPGSVRRVEQQVKEEVFAGTLAASSTRRGSPRLMMTKTVPLVAEFTPAPPKEAVSSPASTKTLVAALSPPPNQALTPASKQFNMTFAPQSSSRTFKRTGRARSTESPRAMSPEERGIQDIPSISGNVHKRSAKEVDDDDGEYSERESTPSSKRAKTSKSSMSKEQERRASKRISTGIIVISQDESTKVIPVG